MGSSGAPKKGRPRPPRVQAALVPYRRTLSQLRSLAIYPSEIPYRYTLPKKALIDVPFRKKR